MPRRHVTKGSSDKLSINKVEVAHSTTFPKAAHGTGKSKRKDDKEAISVPNSSKRSSSRQVQQSGRASDQQGNKREPSQNRPSSRASHAVKEELRDNTNDNKNESLAFNSSSDNVASNTERNKTTPVPSSSNVDTSNKNQKVEVLDDDKSLVPKRHFVWMPFGHGRTWSAIAFIIAGIVLAIFAKRSTSFVALEKPLVLTPHFAPITNVGLVRLDFCFADEHVQDKEPVDMPYTNTMVDVTDKTATGRSTSIGQCSTVRLSSDVVEDTMWQVSRIAASLSIALGIFFCIMLVCTIYWESINLKPMAVGLLITYLLQSFSFFFYDSELCRDHGCKLAMGTYLSILASFCWFGASMMCIVMDVYHARKMKRLARLERRRRRRLRRAEKLARKCSTGTAQTERSEASEEDDMDAPPVMVDEGVGLQGGDWKV